MTHRSRSCRGQTAIEGALVLLVLLVLVLGTLDFGQLLLFHQSLTQRVQAGARYAVVHSYDTDLIKNIVLYNSPTAPPGASAGLFGLTPSQVTITRYDAGDPVNDRIEVTIQDFPMAFYSPLIRGIYRHRPFRVVRPVEGLGATN